MNDEEIFLEKRLTDLARQAERRMSYTYSPFLNLQEQDLFLRIKNTFPVSSALYAPQELAERKLAVFGSPDEFTVEPDLPVRVLRISPKSEHFAEELSHRDYLGAVLNTGIDRGLTGDIIIKGKYAWLFCLESIADYLTNNLTRVRHTEVTVTEVETDIPELRPDFEEIRFNVPSERLDAVVAAFTKLSRTKAQNLFSQKLVFVNSRSTEDVSARLKEGDVLNVRGYGKAIYDGVDGASRKGRLYVVMRKYQ